MGHEIVGIAIRVGTETDGLIKVGDRVGVGCQADACGSCDACKADMPNYCAMPTWTYNSLHHNGTPAMGGYATYQRCPAKFVVKIPDELESADAAPMLCAGVTIYSALKQNRCGPGKIVGIIGLGGLGHFGILMAKALGADKVIAISRKADKAADALKLGADEYASTAEDTEWTKKYFRSMDLIISTVSDAKVSLPVTIPLGQCILKITKAPLTEYLNLVRFDGTFCQIGAPDGGILKISYYPLMINRIKFISSMIGSPDEIGQMLQLAADKKMKPWVEERPMKEANRAVLDIEAGRPKYKYVLVNEQ